MPSDQTTVCAGCETLRRLLRDALAREQALEARLGRQDTEAARDQTQRLRALAAQLDREVLDGTR